nr:hypothetical protein [Rhodospirillales bacterium]
MKIGIPQTLIASSVVLGYLGLYIAMWIFFSTGIVAALMICVWHVHEKTQELQHQSDHEKILQNIAEQFNAMVGMGIMSKSDVNNSSFH